jgi:hypothetical protein
MLLMQSTAIEQTYEFMPDAYLLSIQNPSTDTKEGNYAEIVP